MRAPTTLLLLLWTGSALHAQDTIRFKDRKKNPDQEGEIVELSFKAVKLTIRGVQLQLDSALIADLFPSNDRKGPEFAQGEEAMNNGDFPGAIRRFERVVADSGATPLVRQKAAINIVRCHSAGSNPQGVLESAQSLRSKQPESFYLRESYQREALADLALDNVIGARLVIAALAAHARAHALQGWIDSADLLDAQVAELQKQWRAALGVYRKFARTPDLGDEAILGELRCLTALGDFPGLGALADGILKDSQGKPDYNPRLLIAAYTGKGDVDLNGGKSKEALLGYLHGAMSLSRGETSPEHERSVARSALACVRLAAAESDPAAKATFRSRSRELLEDLLRSYPRSTYRNEIDQAIRSLR